MSIHNLSHYVFKQKNSFLRQPEGLHGQASFLGEVYEAYFYEVLLDLIVQNQLPWRLAVKGPYVEVNAPYVRTGFHCSGDGKCIYNMDGVAFAEFDCLAISQDTVYFYECSISNKCSLALKWEMLKKQVLLQYLFPKHRIVPVVVSVHAAVVAYCGKWHNHGIEAWLIPLPDMDWHVFVSQNQPSPLLKPSHIIGVSELNYLSARVPYFEQLLALTQVLAEENTLQAAYKRCDHLNPCLFSRVYWGCVAGSALGWAEAVPWPQVMVVVDLAKAAHPVLRYYAYQEADKRFFEFTPQLEAVKRIKFSRLELMRVHSSLKMKTMADFALLQAELKDWRHSGWSATPPRAVAETALPAV